MKKVVFTSLILFIILAGVIYQPHPIQAVESPHPSISHCTDLDVAKWRTTDHSNAANVFDYAANFTLYDGRANQISWQGDQSYLLLPPEEAIKKNIGRDRWVVTAPEWRVLIRPGQRFAVFFSADGVNGKPTNKHRLQDANTLGNLYDEDSDNVPDYVERVYSCLVAADQRYSAYYGNTYPDLFQHLVVDHFAPTLPITQAIGINDQIPLTRIQDTYYPVSIIDTPNTGDVRPFDLLISDYTRMLIDNGHYGKLPREDGGSWLYPHLENTIYHEMAHVYQAVNVSNRDMNAFDEIWFMEGSAVYASDQALLPPCPTTIPPRLPGGNTTATCATPTQNQRDSETRFGGNGSSDLFTAPEVPVSAADSLLSKAKNYYSTVLFWYYLQDKLKGLPAVPQADVIRWITLSTDLGGHGGSPRYLLEKLKNYGYLYDQYELYNHFMVANYLQEIPVADPRYHNSYFDRWWGNTNNYPSWSINPSTGKRVVPYAQDIDINSSFAEERYDHSDLPVMAAKYYLIRKQDTGKKTIVINTPPDTYTTFIDAQVDGNDKPTSVNRITSIKGAGQFTANNFPTNPNNKIIVVVSKLPEGDYGDLVVQAFPTVHTATSSGLYISPNNDGRRDRIDVTTQAPVTTSQTAITLITPQGQTIPLTTTTNATMRYTWDGKTPQQPVLADGNYTLHVDYTDTVSPTAGFDLQTVIDTVPPTTVIGVQYTTTAAIDTISWLPSSDSLSQVKTYHVYGSPVPITTLSGLRPITSTVGTRYSHTLASSGLNKYYAVVAEDYAGNRSAISSVPTTNGGSDVIIILDNSDSMSQPALDTAVTALDSLIKTYLQPQDRIGIMPFRTGTTTPGGQSTFPLQFINTSTITSATAYLQAHSQTGDASFAGGSPGYQKLLNAVSQLYGSNPSSQQGRYIVVVTDGEWSDGSEILEPFYEEAYRHSNTTVLIVQVEPDASLGTLYPNEMMEDVVNAFGIVKSGRFASDTLPVDTAWLSQTIDRLGHRLHGAVSSYETGTLAPGQTREYTHTIDTSMKEGLLEIRWTGTITPDIELETPNGAIVTASDPGITFQSYPQAVLIRIQIGKQPAGLWTVRVTNSTQPRGTLEAGSIDFVQMFQIESPITQTFHVLSNTLDLATWNAGQPLDLYSRASVSMTNTAGYTSTFVMEPYTITHHLTHSLDLLMPGIYTTSIHYEAGSWEPRQYIERHLEKSVVVPATLALTGTTLYEKNGTGTITITLQNPITKPLTVTYTTRDGTATIGGACRDYQAASGSFTFTPQQPTRTINLQLYDESGWCFPIYEADETLFLNFMSLDPDVVFTRSEEPITIRDTDPRPTVLYPSPAKTLVITEGNTLSTDLLVVPRIAGTTMVTITSVPVSAQQSDFVAVQKVLSVNSPEVFPSMAVLLQTLDDTIIEQPETFQLQIQATSNIIVPSPVMTVTIVDNDTPPAPVMTLTSIANLTQPRDVVSADFNRDGKPDLAVALLNPNQSSHQIAVLLGDGNGGSTTVGIKTNTNGVVELTAGDINNDGFADLVAAHTGSQHNLQVWLGNGSGGFTAEPLITYNALYSKLRLADINNDALLDLILSDNAAGKVFVRLNTGASPYYGTVASYQVIPSGSINDLITTDIDRDGYLDIITANTNANSISVLKNNQVGGFTIDHTRSAGTHPSSVAALDLNRDGWLDIVAGNQSSTFLSLYFNQQGTLIAQPNQPITTGVTALAVADLNHDAKPDLVATHRLSGNGTGMVSVLNGTGQGGFMAASIIPTGAARSDEVVIADFITDGRLDIITTHFSANMLSILRNQTYNTLPAVTTMSITATASYNGNYQPRGMTLADVTHDGKPDIITTNWSANSLSLLTGTTSGFNTTTLAATVGNPSHIAHADFNRDGKQDLVVGYTDSSQFRIWTNTGNSSFSPSTAYSGGGAIGSISVGDVTKDGRSEVILGGTDGKIRIYHNTGLAWALLSTVTVAPGGTIPSIQVADINRDGNLDLGAVVPVSNTVAIFLGNGSGGFAANSFNYVVASGEPTLTPQSIAFVSINHDAEFNAGSITHDDTMHIAVGYNGNNKVAFYKRFKNRWMLETTLTIAPNLNNMLVTDLNGDGHTDVASIHQGSGNGTLALYAGTHTLSFGPAVTASTGNTPLSMIHADSNRDGYRDIIVNNFGSHTINVFEIR